MSRSDFQLSYEISPIILVGGLAKNLPEQMMPIIALTEQQNYDDGLVSGSLSIDNNDYFATYKVLAGGKLLSNSLGTYPFANQTVAANAIVENVLPISVLMICPVKYAGDYFTKSQVITALKQSLGQHNAAGGTYTVATPGYTYTSCIIMDFTDVSSGESKQAQYEWRIDFVKPLLTTEEAAQVYNSLMNKINNGLPVNKDENGEIPWSGQQLTSDPRTGTTFSTTGGQNLDPSLINSSIQSATSSGAGL